MFPITHAQTQTSIPKFQFISPGLLVSVSSALTICVNKGCIVPVCTFFAESLACVAAVLRGTGRGNLGARERKGAPATTPLFSPFFTLRF